MKTLHKYNTTIKHDGDFYTIVARHNQTQVPQDRLGELVRYYGGDKVLGYEGKYLICNKIQDAEYEDIY